MALLLVAGCGRPATDPGISPSAAIAVSAALVTAPITEFPVTGQPDHLVLGPDGNIWFTEWNAPKHLGRITPAGAVTEYTITGNSLPSTPKGITAGPDGNLWYADPTANQVGRITPAGVITKYNYPSSDSRPITVTFASDGTLTWTEEVTGAIGQRLPSSTVYRYPNGGRGPNGIVPGNAGDVWFTEENFNKIGRLSPYASNGALTEFPCLTGASGPHAIVKDADGNFWFTERAARKIGRLSADGVMTEFPLPSPTASPVGIAIGPDGNIWFGYGASIGRMTTAGVVTEFALPAGVTVTDGIVAGADGNIWFADPNNKKIGRLTVPTFIGCSADEEARIKQALTIAQQQLSDPRLETCLEDAFHNGASTGLGLPTRGSGYPELVISRLRQTVSTFVFCDNNFLPALARASVLPGTNPERILVRENIVLSVTAQEWAATLLHERAHSQHFHHLDDYNKDPIEQIGADNQALDQCSKRISANDAVPKPVFYRSVLTAGEMPMAPVGLDLGDSFNLACPTGNTGLPTSADGLRGYTDSSGIKQLQVSCKVKDRSDGMAYASDVMGAAAGASFTQSCASDQIMVGLYGQGDDYVSSIGALCYSAGYVYDKIPFPSPVISLPSAGPSGPVSWRRVCPSGMAVKAVRGRFSGSVKQLEMLCQDYHHPEKYDVIVSPFKAGGSGGEAVDLECPGRAVAQTIQGVFPQPGTTAAVARMRLRCFETNNVGGFEMFSVTASRTVTVGAGNGNQLGDIREESCPQNPASAIVGVVVKHDRVSVKGVQTVCGSVRNWPRTGTTTVTLPLQGNTSTVSELILCPAGRYLNGVRAEVDSLGVKSLQPLCRSFGSVRSLPQDFGGDGFPDLIARQASTGKVFLYHGIGLIPHAANPGGLNPTPQLIVDGDWRGFDKMFSIGDFYGDGKADVVGRRSGRLELHEGNGKAAWIGTQFDLGDFSAYNALVGPRDFDGDGTADLITRKPDGTLWLWKSTGYNDNWRPGTPIQIGTGWQQYDAIIGVGDFTSDDTQDVLARTPDGRLMLYEGDGRGAFKSATPTQIGTGWQIFDTLLGAGDLDVDGHADLVARKPDGTLWSYSGNGKGGLITPVDGGRNLGSGFQQYDLLLSSW